jgi:hypothetical protein
MREPTDEMIDAWIGAPGAIKEGWQAMIDAALEGKGATARWATDSKAASLAGTRRLLPSPSRCFGAALSGVVEPE